MNIIKLFFFSFILILVNSKSRRLYRELRRVCKKNKKLNFTKNDVKFLKKLKQKIFISEEQFLEKCEEKKLKPKCENFEKILENLNTELFLNKKKSKKYKSKLIKILICKKFPYKQICSQVQILAKTLSPIKNILSKCKKAEKSEKTNQKCKKIQMLSRAINSNLVSLAKIDCLSCEMKLIEEYITICNSLSFSRNNGPNYDQQLTYCHSLLDIVEIKLQYLQDNDYLKFEIRKNPMTYSPRLVSYKFSEAYEALMIYNTYVRDFINKPKGN